MLVGTRFAGHAERLVHKRHTSAEPQPVAQQCVRSHISLFHADLKAYRTNPTPRRRGQLRVRFDRIFRRRTGFVTLDRLLSRLRANTADLLAVLDHPDSLLQINGFENEIHRQLAKRQHSRGSRSVLGRDCRNALLGLGEPCAKSGMAVWDYLGSRVNIAGQQLWRRLPTSYGVADARHKVDARATAVQYKLRIIATTPRSACAPDHRRAICDAPR